MYHEWGWLLTDVGLGILENAHNTFFYSADQHQYVNAPVRPRKLWNEEHEYNSLCLT